MKKIGHVAHSMIKHKPGQAEMKSTVQGRKSPLPRSKRNQADQAEHRYFHQKRHSLQKFRGSEVDTVEEKSFPVKTTSPSTKKVPTGFNRREPHVSPRAKPSRPAPKSPTSASKSAKYASKIPHHRHQY